MSIFQYKGRDANGKNKIGQLVNISENEALATLRGQGIEVSSLSDVTNSLENRLMRLLNPIKGKDLVIFSRQFSVMISAGVTVVESLRILIDQTNNLTLQNMIADMTAEVNAGDFLSDAFARRPKIFSDFFVNIVRSGETSGKLDEVLNYLADEMEKSYSMNSKIRGAMIYPAFIVVSLIGVGVVLMVYVIPNLTSMLTDSGVALPVSTRIVIATSNFLMHYSIMILLVLAALAYGAKVYLKTYQGRHNLDLLKLKMPIFGKMFKYIYVVRFSRSLSTLLKGGVTITRSLEIVAKVVGNLVYEEMIMDTLKSINDGNPLADVMSASPYIPKMVPQMLAVGEKTGRIDSVLDRITAFYQRESEAMVDNLSTLMEPIIMVVMGVGVGIMVAAVLLPMYNLAGQL